MSNETRKFVASAFMLILLVALMGVLVFWAIPPANRDLFITILSVLLGAGAAAIPNLFGDQKGEVTALKGEVADLRQELDIVRTQYNEVKAQYDSIVAMLIKRHVVDGEGIEIQPQPPAPYGTERNDA
jgi:hypothetical protein